MQRLTRLTVLAPGFHRALLSSAPDERLPALERLTARGACARANSQEIGFAPLQTWQAQFAQLSRVEPLPSAPVSALGAGLAARTGTWLHADFVHLAAGLDDLALVPLRAEQALEADALAELHAGIAPHLLEDGYRALLAGHAHFIHTASPLDVETCAPEAASRMPLVEAMPRGTDAPRLRRLMTELQMQLHEHPVNRRRARAGLLAANAMWLWGAGRQPIEPHAPTDLPKLFADDAFARGLYRLQQRDSSNVPADADTLLSEAADRTLLLLHCDALSTLEARWFAPLERALNSGRIQRLDLLLDDIHITAHSWNRWRLWRGVRPLSQLWAQVPA